MKLSFTEAAKTVSQMNTQRKTDPDRRPPVLEILKYKAALHKINSEPNEKKE